MEQIRSSYKKFVSIAGKDGYCVANGDDSEVMLALDGVESRLYTFGIQNDTDFKAVDIRVENGCYRFSVLCFGKPYCEVSLSVFGYHHIYNALAAAAVAWLSGVEGEAVTRGLSAFKGARRRMEYKGKCNGAPLYDDYGHHPTEVRTTLSGAKNIGLGGRLFCVFQPHTYSRTSALFDDFADALRIADRVIVSEIYAARETDTLGVSAQKLACAIGDGAVASESFEKTAELLERELQKGDLCVVMGAGDVWRVFEHIKTEN